jgi:hypothetical protein
VGYFVHLEREDGALIHIEDWLIAVQATADVRLIEETTLSISNPQTGATLSRPNSVGDAEIFDRPSQTWLPCFRWRNGRVSTQAARNFDQPDCHQRGVMRLLAKRLHARISGDEGEIYE